MARIKYPLMSLDARGNIGKGNLVFQGGLGGTFAFKPKLRNRTLDNITQKQTQLRSRYTDAVDSWRNLTDGEKAEWRDRAETDPRPVSGWNLYVEHQLKALFYTNQIEQHSAQANWPEDF